MSLEGWNLSFEARFWASRLDLRLEGVDGEEEGGEEEGEGKISPMCESRGHQPLRSHCPASPSTLSTTYLGRARVPLTI